MVRLIGRPHARPNDRTGEKLVDLLDQDNSLRDGEACLQDLVGNGPDDALHLGEASGSIWRWPTAILLAALA